MYMLYVFYNTHICICIHTHTHIDVFTLIFSNCRLNRHTLKPVPMEQGQRQHNLLSEKEKL